jgi:energy-coupling factor transport system substrate-specific component
VKDRLLALHRHQVTRFLALGGLAAAINWLVRFPLSTVLPFGAAVVVAYLIGMSAGFYLYRTYVFPGSDQSIVQQSLFFLLVNFVGAIVVLGLTFTFIGLQSSFAYSLSVKEAVAHGIAIGFGAAVNFLGHKTLTFRLATRTIA